MSLLKELESEAKASQRHARAAEKWCEAAVHQKSGMADAIQGQLDDAATAARQVQYDANRLRSELALAQGTQKQREQQLQDAISTGSIATEEFNSQQRHLETTLKAARYALAYFRKQSQEEPAADSEQPEADEEDPASPVSNLMQAPGSLLTEKERSVMASYLNDPRPSEDSSSGDQSRELVQTLTELNGRLQEDRDHASQEHQGMRTQLWALTDHLNSSIMEIASQAASIQMEIAQRRREHTRLHSRVSALTRLRAKVKDSQAATGEACRDQQQTQAEVLHYTAEESASLRKVMKKVPLESSEILDDTQEVAASGSPTFLQVHTNTGSGSALRHVLRGLRHMADRYPEESAWFVNAEHQLKQQSPRAASEAAAANRPARQAEAKVGSKKNASSSIQSIEQFVRTSLTEDSNPDVARLPGEERLLLVNAGQLEPVKKLYGSLLADAEVKEKGLSDQLKWCASISRDAKVDGDAVSRSLKRTHAKLNLVQEATAAAEKSAKYCKEQQETLTNQLEQLRQLIESEDHERQRSQGVLSDHAKQLLTLSTELSERPSQEDHKAADLVQGVLKTVKLHQKSLQLWHEQSKKHRDALRAADGSLAKALADESQRGGRRLVWLKAEAQALSAFAHSKANDVMLSGRYLKLSQELCSKEHAALLTTQDQKVREEVAMLQKFVASLTAPTHSA